MNLYLISQDENNNYNTYDSAVVAAESEQAAKQILPGGGRWDTNPFINEWAASPEAVEAKLIGIATEGTKPGVICSSYNAG